MGQVSRSGEEKPEDHPQAQKSMALAKLMGMQAIERIAPVLATLDQAERVYFFAQWLSGELAHMRAAVGHEATRAIVDGLKLAADGNLDAPASENRTRLDGIEESARLLDDTRFEMRAPGNLADYGRGVLKDAADAIRRLKEIK